MKGEEDGVPMSRENILKVLNILLPIVGIGLMIFYEVCDTSCSSLRGTFLGIDLKYVGHFFMAVLLVLVAFSFSPTLRTPVNYLWTMMLSGALGGEIILIRFQIVNDTFCPFCLAFGVCLLVLFIANFMQMNRYLAVASFLAGAGVFAQFFDGSVLPLYSFLQYIG